MAYVRSNLAVVDKIDADRRSVANLGNLGELSLKTLAEKQKQEITDKLIESYIKSWGTDDVFSKPINAVFSLTKDQPFYTYPFDTPIKGSGDYSNISDLAFNQGNVVKQIPNTVWYEGTADYTNTLYYLQSNATVVADRVGKLGTDGVKMARVKWYSASQGAVGIDFYLPLSVLQYQFTGGSDLITEILELNLDMAVKTVLSSGNNPNTGQSWAKGYAITDIPNLAQQVVDLLIRVVCWDDRIAFLEFAECQQKGNQRPADAQYPEREEF